MAAALHVGVHGSSAFGWLAAFDTCFVTSLVSPHSQDEASEPEERDGADLQ